MTGELRGSRLTDRGTQVPKDVTPRTPLSIETRIPVRRSTRFGETLRRLDREKLRISRFQTPGAFASGVCAFLSLVIMALSTLRASPKMLTTLVVRWFFLLRYGLRVRPLFTTVDRTRVSLAPVQRSAD